MRMDVNRSRDQTIHSSSTFSKKVDVRISGCGMLCWMWNDYRGVWLQVGGMKYKYLEEELCRRNRRNVEEEEEEEEEEMVVIQMGSLTFVPLSSVPLHTLTSLYSINLEDTEELPSELFRSLSRLRFLNITDFHRLENCKELDLSSMDQEEDNKAVQDIPNSQTKIRRLILADMDKMKILPPWIQYLPKIEFLELEDCKNMETLPGWFSQLTWLKRLRAVKCEELWRKCQRDTGECWPRISHIENVVIGEGNDK